MRVGAEPLSASRLLGVLFGAATLLVVYRFTRVLGFELQAFQLTSILLVSLNICFAAYLVSGMETGLFTFLVTWSAYRAAVELRDSNKWPWSSLLFAIAALTRPEGLMFFGITWLFRLAVQLRRREPIKSSIVSLLVFSAVFAPYFLWRYNYYGYPLPNTFYAKVGATPAQFWRGIKYVLRFFAWFFGGGILLVVPVAYLSLRNRSVLTTYLLAGVALYLAYIAYVGGEGNPLFRFIVPILPSVSVIVAYGLSVLWQDWSPKLGALRAKGGTLALVFGIGCAVVTLAPYWHYKKLADASADLVENLIEQGRWLKANSEPGDTLATPLAGALAYYSELHTFDMLGLTDEHIAHVEIPTLGQFPLAGHEKNDPEYIFAKRPTWIWVSTNPSERWLPGTNELVNLPGFSEVYEPFRVPLSSGKEIEIYRKKQR